MKISSHSINDRAVHIGLSLGAAPATKAINPPAGEFMEMLNCWENLILTVLLR